MSREDLKDLISVICNTEYEYRSYNGEKTKKKIISGYDGGAEKQALEKAVFEWGISLADEDKAYELGELKAKCYAYEKIIANSNFAPLLLSEKVRGGEND